MTTAHISRLGHRLCLGGAAIGALGLVGAILGTDRLTTIVPGQPPMMPNTALGLLLLGGVGALRRKEAEGSVVRTLRFLATFFVLILATTTVLEYVLDVDLDVDQLLVQGLSGPHPGRPSPPTALALCLLAAALLLFDYKPAARLRPSEWLALSAGLVAFTAFMGFVFGVPPLYRLARTPVIGVAPMTAVGLLLISLGMLIARPETGIMRVVSSSGAGGIMLRRLVLPAILAPVVLGELVTRILATYGTQDVSIVVAILVATMGVVALLLVTITAAPLDRAQERLEASRAQTRSLVQQAPDGIFVADLTGRYTDVNDAGCQITGYSRDEIIGKTIVDLVPPEDVERIWQVKASLLGGATDVGEWKLLRKDGAYVPVEVSTRILPDGRWQGFVRDITERKRLEREQRFLTEVGRVLATTLDYEETLSRIADTAVRGLAEFCIVDVVSEEGEINRLRVVSRDPARAAICERLQRMPVDARPTLIRSVLESRQPVLVAHVSPEDVAAAPYDDDDRRALAGSALESAIVVPLVAHDRLLGTIAFLSSPPSPVFGAEDLRVAQELALRAALAVDNARLYRAAQRAIKVRDEVLGIVAHDLRNPLAAIVLEAGLIQRGGADSERRSRASVDAIKQATARMNGLIEDLLDVTRMEAGQLTIEQTRAPAARVVADAFDAHKALASSAGLELRLSLPPNLPHVWADRNRLLQVLENLIGNAIKFTPSGGRVTVGAAPRDTDVLFRVTDSGPGIAVDDQAHLFDRFWQERKTTYRGGAGLGLPIVKGIVEAHGGDVWVESTIGQGSTFFFTIPTVQQVERGPAYSVDVPSVSKLNLT